MPLIISKFRGNIEASKGEILDEGQWIIVNPADWSEDEIEQARVYFEARPKEHTYPLLLGKWVSGYAPALGEWKESIRWAGFDLYPHFYYDYEDVTKWDSLEGMLKALWK